MTSATRQLRQAALAALAGLKLGDQTVNIQSPGDWAVPPGVEPVLKLRSPMSKKTGKQKSVPEFDTTVFLELQVTLQDLTAEIAQDRIENLENTIETKLFGNQGLMKLIQQCTIVERKIEISSVGKMHTAIMTMVFGLEVFEAFNPVGVLEGDSVDTTEKPGSVLLPLDEVRINWQLPDAINDGMDGVFWNIHQLVHYWYPLNFGVHL